MTRTSATHVRRSPSDARRPQSQLLDAAPPGHETTGAPAAQRAPVASVRFAIPKRIALASATSLAAINIWTGSPLLALWVGSKVVGDSSLSMGAVFVVVAVLAACVLSLTAALSWLSARYDNLIGRPAAARRTSPWLRSMRGEREDLVKRKQGISAIERIVVIAVVACAITCEVWFFFFAHYSLPNGP